MNDSLGNILVIDDDPAIHRMIGRIFRHKPLAFESVHGGAQALLKLQSITPDLILLDLSMPGMDGFEVAERIRDDFKLLHIPVIILTGMDGTDILSRALGECADDFISKTADPSEIIARVSYHLKRKQALDQLHDEKVNLNHMVSLKSSQLALALEKLKDASLEVIWRLTSASEYRDNETGAHIQRMSHYAAIIASQMGLKKKTVDAILYAAPMHDIGKIGIPDRILLKPGKFDDAEWEIMKTHTQIGADILKGSAIGFVRMGEIIALTHHERWDGSGYPLGLKEKNIPMVSRIVAIADVFDALTSERPYKKTFSVETATRIINESSGTHFDPTVVNAFFASLDKLLAVRNKLGKG
ncbi:HD-GYP domain-containing protein [Desulfosarcina ovata]|uniref:Two-component system response regulator n=2 Tax=Desulfosarcina ovata TaxID=83564 RepID=A0A5K8AG66_9BACT|nr:HD domain-containing phosphohydrolase [Desulfosarcina ovata]BBO82906.1 two-component system response regulator [Desulfosarcina ovata subsp. sediminis]BBO91683.1 two-component system response regulator [Desulfosarcina ovata subsp. ovata]